jgi:hypothetical protein
MNRQTYSRVRRSIRDNGLAYTARHAVIADDTDALLVCDDYVNVNKKTDWLAMRQQFARTSAPAVAIRLTTSIGY